MKVVIKILLTGQPGSGKTTLLEGFVSSVPNAQGFVTREVKKNGERVGFELVSSQGQTATLANINSDSPTRVSRYGVNVDELGDFITALPSLQPGNLVYIDEIGQMQLLSDPLKSLVTDCLDSGNPYAGTITSVYNDTYVEKVVSREDIILLKVNTDNRESIKSILDGLSLNLGLIEQLESPVRMGVIEIARKYAQDSSYVQLNKLFKNAVKYVAKGRVNKFNSSSYRVQGNTKSHQVTKGSAGWVCDCDLFSGTGDFIGQPGVCSHIQAVLLSNLES